MTIICHHWFVQPEEVPTDDCLNAYKRGTGSLMTGRPILWIVDENDETVLLIEERRYPCGLTDDEHEAAGLEPGVFS